jgi:hypothetical protein
VEIIRRKQSDTAGGWNGRWGSLLFHRTSSLMLFFPRPGKARHPARPGKKVQIASKRLIVRNSS